jgi:hypothetical protein
MNDRQQKEEDLFHATFPLTQFISRTLFIAVLLLIPALSLSALTQTGVQDIFGRSLNEHGITLVDYLPTQTTTLVTCFTPTARPIAIFVPAARAV